MNIINKSSGFSNLDRNDQEEIDLYKKVIIGMNSWKPNADQKLLYKVGPSKNTNQLINSYQQ